MIKIKKKGVIIWIVLICVLIALLLIEKQTNSEEIFKECSLDSDCVKDSCCHASNCVPIENAPKCEMIMCSMECKPGTLDCGQGECRCVNNKCEVFLNGLKKERN